MSDQFEDLARKAAAGELSPAERMWLDDYLRDHPAKRAELEWDRAFRDKLSAKIEAMPSMPGWARTEHVLRTESARATSKISPKHEGLLDRLSAWFNDALGLSLNVQAIAAALVIAQAGVIGFFVWQYRDGPQYSEIRTGTQGEVALGPVLRVSFKQDVREADLRKALADIGGEIVGGPGQLGVYLVRVKGIELAVAAERLRATGATELVELYEPKR